MGMLHFIRNILRGWENIRGSAYIFCEKPLISLLSVELGVDIGGPRDFEKWENTNQFILLTISNFKPKQP